MSEVAANTMAPDPRQYEAPGRPGAIDDLRAVCDRLSDRIDRLHATLAEVLRDVPPTDPMKVVDPPSSGIEILVAQLENQSLRLEELRSRVVL